MATEYATVDVWVAVDESGDHAVGMTQEEAGTAYDDTIGGTGVGMRYVKVTIRVPLPTPLEVTGEVTVDEQPGELKAVG